MTTLSIKAACPQCKKGDIEISLDDYNWIHISTPHLKNNNQILHIKK